MKGKKIDDLAEAKKEMEANLEMADEDESDEDDHVPIFTSELAKLKEKEMGKVMKNTDPDAGEDEDIGMDMDHGDDGFASEFSDSSEEKDDYNIRKSDSLIVTATADDDHSNLEVYVYDHKNGDLYVHHELILGSYPLCLEWLKVWDKKQTNHIIVGTFLPEIEIWNLDSEAVEPTAILGDLQKSEDFKSGKKDIVKKYNNEDIGTHTEAVMCLSLNPF